MLQSVKIPGCSNLHKTSTLQLCSMPKSLDFPCTIVYGLLDVWKEEVTLFQRKIFHLMLKTALKKAV